MIDLNYTPKKKEEPVSDAEKILAGLTLVGFSFLMAVVLLANIVNGIY